MRHIPPHTFVCLGVSRPSAIVKAWPGHQSSEGIIQTSKHTTWLTGDSPAHSVVGHRGQKYWILIFLILYLSSYILVTVLFKTQFTYWTWLTKRKPMKTSDCFGYFNYATSWGWASQTKILPSVVWKVWLKHKRLKPDCPTVAENGWRRMVWWCSVRESVLRYNDLTGLPFAVIFSGLSLKWFHKSS